MVLSVATRSSAEEAVPLVGVPNLKVIKPLPNSDVAVKLELL